MLSVIHHIQIKVDFDEDQIITLGHIFIPNTSIRILMRDSITNVTSNSGIGTNILLIGNGYPKKLKSQ